MVLKQGHLRRADRKYLEVDIYCVITWPYEESKRCVSCVKRRVVHGDRKCSEASDYSLKWLNHRRSQVVCLLTIPEISLQLTSQLILQLKLFLLIKRCCSDIYMPVPVAARSKAQVCGRSPAEIVCSNSTGDMDVCLLWVLCVVRQRSLRRADHSSRGVLPTVLRRCV